MRDYLVALKTVLYNERFELAALVIACVGWIVFASMVENFIGKEVLDVLVYGLVGWYWLGRIVAPWIERKLEKLFDN